MKRQIPKVPVMKSGDFLLGKEFWISCCGCGLRHLFATDKEVALQVFTDSWGSEANRALNNYPMVERKKKIRRG